MTPEELPSEPYTVIRAWSGFEEDAFGVYVRYSTEWQGKNGGILAPDRVIRFDVLASPAQKHYPFIDGPHLVIGPECFTGDGDEVDQDVISWRGENYYLQARTAKAVLDRVHHETAALDDGTLDEIAADFGATLS